MIGIFFEEPPYENANDEEGDDADADESNEGALVGGGHGAGSHCGISGGCVVVDRAEGEDLGAEE